MTGAEVETNDRPPPGQWYLAPESTDDTAARARALEAIGYASHGGELALDATGVLTCDEERAAPGLRLYCSGHAPEVFLIDLHGALAHHWSFDLSAHFGATNGLSYFFRRVTLLRDGTLLGIVEGVGLVALAPDSSVRWTYREPVHHDAREDDDGTLYVLDRHAGPRTSLHPSRPFLDDGLLFLDPDGKPLGRVSLVDALLDSPFGDEVRALFKERVRDGLVREAALLEEHADRIAQNPELRDKLDLIGDLLHCNSVERIAVGAVPDDSPLRAGWYLISCRELDALFAVEVNEARSSGVVRWWKRGAWRRQHEASVVEGGRVLLFDNLGAGSKSRALVIDPASGEIEWKWPEGPDPKVVSPVGGTARRVAGGNTIVVESTSGRAFEVDPSGELVWTYRSPHRAGVDQQFVAFLAQIEVIEDPPPGPWDTER